MAESCFVAVSGGVDSAVALHLLKQQGYNVSGITMVCFGNELLPNFVASDAEDAKRLCENMGVPHYLADLKAEFKEKVINDFILAYSRGETPNPCIACNKHLKFGSLVDFATKNGAEKYATGHYVRVVKQGDRQVIARAMDDNKDQTYMLWRLSAQQISNFIAPLGEYTKSQVREIAQGLGLAVANKGDSQDICFIPDGDYRGFLSRVSDLKESKGDFVHINGRILGKHNGQSCYTIGQRKGLGIAYSEPLYVIGRDMAENRVILGSNGDLFTTEFYVREANFSALYFPAQDINCQCKIRYRANAVDCRIIPLENHRLRIETATPVRAVTPGQSAVFYDGDILLGGGIIEN